MALPWPCLVVPFSCLWKALASVRLGLSFNVRCLPTQKATDSQLAEFVPCAGHCCGEKLRLRFLRVLIGGLHGFAQHSSPLLSSGFSPCWTLRLSVCLHSFFVACTLCHVMYGGREKSSLWRNSMLARAPVPIYPCSSSCIEVKLVSFIHKSS